MEDVDYLKDKDVRIIAINDNYTVAPFADVLYACDFKWWNWHNGAPEFEGDKWSMDKKAVAQWPDINYIEGLGGKEGLNTDPRYINTGQNSGFQAINLAYHFGASRIILLGYDMQFAKDGRSHWFGDHPDKIRSNYNNWLDGFANIAKQNLVEIINCTRDTALDMFPKIPLREAI